MPRVPREVREKVLRGEVLRVEVLRVEVLVPVAPSWEWRGSRERARRR